jgi:hypothetical protein
MGKAKRSRRRREFALAHPNAAAIDIGATKHMAAVGPDCDPEPVRSFGTFTVLPSFLGAVRDEAEIRGWLAILPFALLSCGAIAAGIAYCMPQEFWSEQKRELSVSGSDSKKRLML